ncbi:MAG: major capsid protein [Alphaproteobacteria bacterium]
MPNMIDIFNGDAFSVQSLSAAINLVPKQYGLVNEMGIFKEEGVSTTLVSIERKNGVLNLIPTTKRGDPAPKNKSGKRDMLFLEIPHIPLEDKILPKDIQNVRQFGTEELQSAESVTNDKLVEMARKHDITNEWHKVGALQGKILDADGSTLLNLFTEFGVTEQTVNFVLGTGSTDILGKCLDVKGKIEDALLGDTMAGVVGLWDPALFARFIAHAEVKAAYANYQNQVVSQANYASPGANPLRDDVRNGFYFGGILHREYRGQATDAGGTNRKFITDATARFFPVGTMNTFKHFNAPADWMETVNTKGLPRYAKVVPEIGGRYVELLSEQNPLPLCLQPKVLIKGYTSN